WQEGLIITEAEGVAQTAGLLAGDIIQTMNNQPVKTISDLEKILNEAPPQPNVTLEAYRKGARFTVSLPGTN
ncbi:MAG: PDZ domain-containing protein, partial [Candidatus Riflebacteria bacterium]|nr:PDZ domain-containing protein [Candidatus Riflebacteria bacterium]